MLRPQHQWAVVGEGRSHCRNEAVVVTSGQHELVRMGSLATSVYEAAVKVLHQLVQSVRRRYGWQHLVRHY